MATSWGAGFLVLYSNVTRSCCKRSANSVRSSMVFFKAKPNAATTTSKRMMIFMILFGTNGGVKQIGKIRELL